MPYKAFRVAVVLLGSVIAVPLGAATAPAVAQGIYDSRVQERIELTPQQRPQVERIVAERRRQVLAVFNKYGIDPNALPVFEKLVQASGELMAIERQERQAMKAVLTREQLVEYDRIVDDMRIRVRKAAR